MKAISIRQPWAWLILHAGKNIENRDWQPRNPCLRFRGTCLIHTGIPLQPISDELRAWVKQTAGVDLPRSDGLPRGGIVGQVDVIDVALASSSPWFEGPCGLVLANPKPLPFRVCRGRLGFFRVLPMECQVSAALDAEATRSIP
jgi:ASCH domain